VIHLSKASCSWKNDTLEMHTYTFHREVLPTAAHGCPRLPARRHKVDHSPFCKVGSCPRLRLPVLPMLPLPVPVPAATAEPATGRVALCGSWVGFLFSDGRRRKGTVLGLPWPVGHRWQHWRRVRLDSGGGVCDVDSSHAAFEEGTNLPATTAPDTAQATAARGGRKRRGLSAGTDPEPPAEADVQSRPVKRARAAVVVAVAAESKTRRERVLARPAKRPAKTNAAGVVAAAAAKAGAAKSKAKANAKAQAVKKKGLGFRG
jgi:hypothetical protein